MLQVHVGYSQELHNIQNVSPYMIKKVKINKVDKLMPNSNNHEKYVVEIRALN